MSLTANETKVRTLAQNVERGIRKALQAGSWVRLDLIQRYWGGRVFVYTSCWCITISHVAPRKGVLEESRIPSWGNMGAGRRWILWLPQTPKRLERRLCVLLVFTGSHLCDTW